jgi:hypothetical protein
MSRSYKKTPWCGDHKGKVKKRLANKSVRAQLKENPDFNPKGGMFKKLYCSWNICDYGWITPWEEYWESCLRQHAEWVRRGWNDEEPDRQKEYQRWLRFYHNK